MPRKDLLSIKKWKIFPRLNYKMIKCQLPQSFGDKRTKCEENINKYKTFLCTHKYDRILCFNIKEIKNLISGCFQIVMWDKYLSEVGKHCNIVSMH